MSYDALVSIIDLIVYGIPYCLIVGILWRIFKKLK